MTCAFQDCAWKLNEEAQQRSSDGDSNTSRRPRDLPWQTFRLCPAEGNAFDGDMKRRKNRNEKKLDHIAFGRFRLKTAQHGEAIRKGETLWPHCQLSCYTTNTSQVSLYSFSSSCCLSLSSISYQELPPINRESRHQARNLRRLDLFSRLSQHHFQAQPVPREGRWTTWNHLNAAGSGVETPQRCTLLRCPHWEAIKACAGHTG